MAERRRQRYQPGHHPTIVANDSFEISIPGTAAIVYFQLRALNTDKDPDLESDPVGVTVSRGNTPAQDPSFNVMPENLTLVAGGDKVTLSWNEPVDTTNLEWQCQQRRDSLNWEDWTFMALTPSGGRYTFELTTQAERTAWTFKVRAVDNKGSTTGSSPRDDDEFGVEREIGPVTVGTNPPTNLAVTTITGDQNRLKLAWAAPSGGNGINDYEYRQQEDGGIAWGAWTSAGNDTVETVASLKAGTKYNFQVRAKVDFGSKPDLTSEASETASGTTVNPPAPNKSENLTGTGIIGGARFGWDRVTRGAPAIEDDTVSAYRYQTTTSAQVTLSWDDPGNSAITEWQYRQSETEAGLKAASWNDIGSSEATTITHTVTGLNAGGSYFFEVRPYTDTPLDAVEIAAEASGDFSGLTLWTAFSSDADAVEGTVTGLGASAHYLRIQAANPGGDSPASDAVLFTSTAPDNGTWTYQVVVNPNRFFPAAAQRPRFPLWLPGERRRRTGQR